MLIKLQVKNFRKLREKTIEFSKGLNVVRGSNEQGKSTMLEAITYAFFGVSACRTPLADMVTWGEPETSLKVVLDFSVEGTCYRISRSKSGAECRYGDGGVVVGQKEVTAFVGRLFGVEPWNINNLLLAGQGDIRGALSRGSTKTAALIEDLANFDVIDKVVTLIGEKLLVGSPTPFEEKVARLMPELAGLEAALLDVPDTAEQEAEWADIQPQLDDLEDQAEGCLKALEPVVAERDRLAGLIAERARLDERVTMLREQSIAETTAHNKLNAAQPPAPDQARIVELQGLLGDAERTANLRALKREIEAFPYPEVFWDKPLEDLQAERQKLVDGVVKAKARFAEVNAQIRVAQASIITATACGLCGKDLSAVPEVVEKNSKAREALANLSDEASQIEDYIRETDLTLTAMSNISAEQRKVEQALIRFGPVAGLNKSTVPWHLSYAGPALPDNDNASVLREELAALNAQARAVIAWQAQLDQQAYRVVTAEKALLDAIGAHEHPRFAGIDGEHTATEAKISELNGAYAAVIGRVHEMKDRVTALQGEINTRRAVYDAAKARVDGVRASLKEARENLDAVNFNNALLKRVRAARPIISNKLWSMVLSAVSRYFSQMRGEESVVTKDADGFKVNAQPIEALSGSTLDLLGLSIRLALVRTFLPQSPFLILDEPSAACDTARTEAMMGFLVAAGFDQMLIVTHEDMSEQVATSLIEI